MRWEDPDLPEIPKPHSLFAAAWKKVDKDLQRVKSGLIDPGYRFPKLTLLVNVTTPDQKKTYLLNWLAACPLWLSQVDLRPPSKILSPQMWRDFLNTIDVGKLSSMKSASTKSAVLDILGENVVQSAQGLGGGTRGNYVVENAGEFITLFFPSIQYSCDWYAIQVQVSSLLDPPLQFICPLLWELYELNFRFELYALDRCLIPHLWATDEAVLVRRALLYAIFPGESGLLMWSETLPQNPHEVGICANDCQIAYPYINNFRELLSVWPGAPSRLQSLVEPDGHANTAFFDIFVSICQFYVQTAFDFFGQQPSLPRRAFSFDY